MLESQGCTTEISLQAKKKFGSAQGPKCNPRVIIERTIIERIIIDVAIIGMPFLSIGIFIEVIKMNFFIENTSIN